MLNDSHTDYKTHTCYLSLVANGDLTLMMGLKRAKCSWVNEDFILGFPSFLGMSIFR